MVSRKILFFPLVIFLGLMAAGSPSRATDTAGASASTIPTADPLASPKTKAVLNYLFNLPTGTSNRIISGQFTQDMSEINGVYHPTRRSNEALDKMIRVISISLPQGGYYA